MSPLLEVIGGTLVKGVLGEVAGSVRRKLSGDPAQAALKKAVFEALEGALQQSGLSPEVLDHSESFFRELFSTEAVHLELALLLDPRPDLSLDLDRLAQELEEGGLDYTTLPGFDLKKFLGAFAVAFYSAAGKQDSLRGVLDLKLLGLMVDRLGTIARSTDRMADGVDRLNENVEGLRRELPEFLAGRIGEAALLAAVYALGSAGMIPAFDGLRLLQKTVNEAGYDMVVNLEGQLSIAGASEERALPPARLGALEKVAAELRRAVDAQKPNLADLDALAERYRQHIVRWFQHLSFQGMTPTARAILLPLEKVYVELRAVAEVPEAADSFSVEERRLLLEADDRDPKGKDELLRQLDVLRRERWGRSIPERKSIAAALYHRDQRAFVILGDPGSGKSTLLHFLALVHAQGSETAANRLEIDAVEADRLPIFVPLAAFDDMLRETPGLTLLEFLPRYYDRRRGLPGLGPLFLHALETGRALLLLDGLDEVLDSGTRGYVAQQAGALIGEWSLRGVRFAVSSRFVGYREAPMPGSLPTLSVLDFGEKEIEVFVHRWSHAYEAWAAGDATPEALRKARDLERDLLDDVRSNDSVRRLAANPLMLTLLALLRRQVGKLPHRRVQLYEAYVSTMLDNWLAARSQGAREKAVVALDRHQAENILIPMALWLQREKPSGTAGRAELESMLTEICLKEKGHVRETATVPQLREAEEHARRFLREMREMTGLLVARGYDAFGFLHLTFQEYFAGRALALLGADERWEILHSHLHDPRWREPILLCAGRLGVAENRRKEVTIFVRRILSTPDPTESDLHRNLLLALAVACDDVNLDPAALEELIEVAVQCLPTKVYAFGSLLLGFLARLIADGVADLERCLGPVRLSGDSGLEAIALESLGRFAEKLEIRTLLMEKLGAENEFVRGAAVGALAGSVSDPSVRQALLDQLGQNVYVDDAVIRSLSSLLPGDRQVCDKIFERLGYGLGTAAQVLAVVAPKDSETRDRLIEAFSSEDAEFQRGAALLALSGVVAGNRGVRDLAMAALADENDSVRSAAISVLSTRMSEDHEARSSVLSSLENEGWTRYAAINALAPQVVSNEAVRQAIIKRLSDPYSFIRGEAMRALVPLLHSEEVRNVVLAQVTSVNWEDRHSLAEILGESSGVVGGLRELLEIRDREEAEESSAFVAACLKPLMAVAKGKDFVVSCLADPQEDIRMAAVEALAESFAQDTEVREALLARLDDDSSEVWGAVVSALLVLLDMDVEIRESVLARLRVKIDLTIYLSEPARLVLLRTGAEFREALMARLGDINDWVRESAVSALSVLVGRDADVRDALLALLEDDDEGVRVAAISALAVLVERDGGVRDALLALLEDDDEGVRGAAISALAVLVGRDGGVRDALLALLKDDGGEVRGAAVSALAVLVGLDAEVRDALLIGLGDNSGDVRTSAVSSLSRLVVSDAEVRDALLARLEDEYPLVRQAAVDAAGALLGVDVKVRTAAIEALRDGSFEVRAVAAKVLLAVLADRMNDWELLSNLQPWIACESDYSDVPGEVQKQFASSFGPRLLEDPDLREWVLERLGDVHWAARLGATLTLLAWPEGPPPEIIERIFASLKDRRGPESYHARLAAASFLINRNEDHGVSIDLCLEALAYGTQPWEGLSRVGEIRKQAALVLGKLEPLEHNERVYNRLLQVMKEDEEHQVRDAAYNALVRLAGVRDRPAVGVSEGGSGGGSDGNSSLSV